MSFNSEIDKLFEPWAKKDSPGMAIAVRQGRDVVHRNAYGMADLDHNIENTPETVFHCASLAKQFTAMSILLLSDKTEPAKRIETKRKKPLSLDEDVRDHIDELKGLDDKKYPKITIGDLLHNTSGIRDMLTQLTLAGWRWGDDAMSAKDVMDLVSRMKTPNFTPGSQFAYSNTNYFLAGEIVARVSGMPLADFAQKHIFAPLKMANTRFVNTYCETVKNRAYGYRKSDRVKGPPWFEKRIPNYDLTGPTNLFTTVDDLLLWDANFDPKPHSKFDPPHLVGGASAVAALQSPPQGSTSSYGLGLYVAVPGRTPLKIYHNGRTIGYRAHYVRDNEHDISIALLCNVEFTNVAATDSIVNEVSDLVREGPPGTVTLDEFEIVDPPGTRKPEALEEYCGKYFSSEIDTEYEVLSDGAALWIKRPGHPDAKLADFADESVDTFVTRYFTEVLRVVKVTFERENKKITELKLDWPGDGARLMDFRFVKRK